MLAYCIILATAVASMFGASLWAGIACGCGLALISIREHGRYQARYAPGSGIDILSISAVTSLVNGLLAGGAAWVLGRMCWWIWGGLLPVS